MVISHMPLPPTILFCRAARGARLARNLWFGCCLLTGINIQAIAVERVVRIDAPATAIAGSKVTVSIHARTDAGGGEHIGFFHAEYSTDSGKTWTAFCYEEKAGSMMTRQTSFTAGAAGITARVRVRIAFRGGQAGDVDFNGAALNWADSWGKWSEPPAKYSTTASVTQ